MPEQYKPFNQDTDPAYNQKGGVVVVQGSALAKEMERFEQFPSKWGSNPGNPYTYRPFPKMMYRADKINGKPFVQMPEPQNFEFATRDQYKAAMARKEDFDRRCQRIVNDETEMSRAYEDGWRDSPDAAIQHVLGVDEKVSRATAERKYSDQYLSEKARAEAKAAEEAVGNEHLPEIPEQPIRRRGRPKGSKNKPKE